QQNCFVISGSSRTALSIIGQHCGIKNILTFDWSWSYDNGFDNVSYVPLLKKGKLNSDGLLNELHILLQENPLWPGSSAVIINNPHNASGRVFSSAEIQSLIIKILDQNIHIIDDLCYQDVAPSTNPVKFHTVKELAIDAVKKGLLTSDKLKLLITVHSLSKTDCYAGARVTVAEICDTEIAKHFEKIKANIIPNTMALFISYLFYRSDPALLQNYWTLRNKIFFDRSSQIKQAVDELPNERNAFNIELQEPQGSMYPHLIIHNFPSGISIDNISRRLAQRGFGLIPMTAFSKTAEGFEKARKSFRLTLGGLDDATTLRHKTRRLVIELNRLLHEEAQAYREFRFKSPLLPEPSEYLKPVLNSWTEATQLIKNDAPSVFEKLVHEDDASSMKYEFVKNYLPWRLAIINKRVLDTISLYSRILSETQNRPAEQLIQQLSQEFYKEEIQSRQSRFKTRLFDRTVHPTQMFSLKVDLLTERFLNELVFSNTQVEELPAELTSALVEEYLGTNVPINSEQEAYELIFDLKSYIQTELFSDKIETPLLSFWGDWDGSTRPSGQGHRLIAAVLLENVRQLAGFLHALKSADRTLHIENSLTVDIEYLSKGIKKFWELLNKITRLTNQLEKKYKGLLPGDLHSGRIRQLAVKLKLRRDPIHILLSHNNRLEKRMLKLRQERKESLEYYFELNKRLRKKLHDSIPNIIAHLNNPKIALFAGSYRNLLKRFVLTPRIHQKTITSDDPFTIENTVHNLSEINQIGSRFGNPGLIVALQISMSTHSAALIELSRMISRKTESLNKELTDTSRLKNIWLVPLFEDQDSLHQLGNYLDDIWKFAHRSRLVKQSVTERFLEIICEIFVAGSDLSQQVGQAKSWELYKQTKAFFYSWLADKDLLGQLRIKLGSGEPMQRQGGYYSANSGKAVLWNDNINLAQLNGVLRPSAQKNLFYAVSPLKGVQSGGDIRTIQSNASEQIFRFLNLEQRAQLFYHISNLQKTSLEDLHRVSKTFKDTRMVVKDKRVDEINRLSGIYENELFTEFLNLHSESFRQIIYGTDEDIIGIHVISYFISRMVPVLRDRPTVRPSKETSQLAGQKIVERIAQTLPLSRHGSLLRAIGHNRSQSMILGVNQLTTGLFRSLKIISDGSYKTNLGSVLSHLPVAEILHDLRIYQQMDLKYIKYLEPALNTGNSGLHALYEDMEYLEEFVPHLQRELIERQGLNAADFFIENHFKEELLPYFRPDLVVLLQKDLFNTNPDYLLKNLKANPDADWLKRVNILLDLPEKIKNWRGKIWELIGSNIYQQVSSFVDLAKALTTISQKSQFAESTISLGQSKSNRLVNQINTLLRGAADDSMRQLLYSVVEFISRLPEDSVQIPIDTMRALQDIERIIKIDELLLSNKEQSRLRYYILQIARLAGENG
ncbi:MAG: aminotransferase class I/II-fold pyridoxal phosphate-dependent enzyme, partial [Calditrichaeota bacterium]|nr:aminotransferase class I/II-fold pyridoxal phosphate-dependent enzyme [Calditrichota bacterium]